MLRNFSLKELEDKKTCFKTYKKHSSNLREINWYDLPDTLCVEVENLNLERKNITIKRLKRMFGNNKIINNHIKSIFNWRYNYRYNIPIKFPLNLENKHYVRLYSLMVSEGSVNSEFRLHVPEEHLHQVFVETLNGLFGKSINTLIKKRISNNIKLQYASQIIRYLVPIMNHVPKLILENKEFARDYLKIAFESEGSAYLNKKRYKRYIKLTRNVGIDELINTKLKYKPGQRIFLGRLKKDYPSVYKNIFKKVQPILLGESLLLYKHFDIENMIKPEALLINKTNFRTGYYSVRWNLYIYAEPIDRFIEEINFMSKEKRKRCKEMLKFKSNKPAFFALKIMKKVSKGNIFRAKNFKEEMKSFGYVSPGKYIWDYKRKGIIANIKKGYYKLL